MEEKKYEKAYKGFIKAVRNAILSEEIPVTITALEGDYWFAEMDIEIGGCICKITVSDNQVCYHNELLKGMFEGKHFEALKDYLRNNQKVYTPEEKARLKELRAEILKIAH